MNKNNTYQYRVAGHVFVVCDERTSPAELLMPESYKPFVTEPTTDDPTFTLRVVDAVDDSSFQQEVHQDDDGSEIIVGRLTATDGFEEAFRFLLRGQQVGTMVANGDYTEARLTICGQEQRFALDNALMVMYALSTATHLTALFHSSVVSCDGRAFMFLGKSGTGKSTHSRLWLKHINGTELMNDDNPVVRIVGGEAFVYGSPWSGKTPCYRNVSAPLGAIVQLSQAPHNSIRTLKSIQAYAALVPSISGKRWNKHLAEGLHQTENWLAQHAHIYHLECLPDAAAAELCHKTVATHRKTLPNNVAIENVRMLVDEGRSVILPVKGNSMLPFIIGDRDSVELKKTEHVSVGDVVLAWVDGSRYVIHRVISRTPDGGLTLMGDGNISGTEHTTERDVVAKAFWRVQPDGRKNLLYNNSTGVRLWRQLLPVRRWLLAIYRRTVLKLIK
ncbi:MAG: hypothetical protein IJ527_09910 [Prevotella sp.]|nr:hypothetical protein [Prevotella sp.]